MADQKITQLNENTAPVMADLLALVDDPSGSPETQKIELETLFPRARVYNDTDITISNATWTALTFNAERFDSENIHSTVSNTGRLTAPRNGLYLIAAHVMFESNATGFRVVQIQIGGSTGLANITIPAPSGTEGRLSLSTIYYMTAAQYVEARVYQTSGGDLDVKSNAAFSPEFMIAMIGPGA